MLLVCTGEAKSRSLPRGRPVSRPMHSPYAAPPFFCRRTCRGSPSALHAKACGSPPCFHVCVSRCGPEADGPLFCVAILVDAALASAALLVRHRAPRGRQHLAHRRCALAAALSTPSCSSRRCQAQALCAPARAFVGRWSGGAMCAAFMEDRRECVRLRSRARWSWYCAHVQLMRDAYD